MNRIIIGMVHTIKNAKEAEVSNEGDVCEQFHSVNLANGFHLYKVNDAEFSAIATPYYRKNVQMYVVSRDDDKEISDKQLYNLNNNSGYRLTLDTSFGTPICNYFMDASLIHVDNFAKLSKDQIQRLLKNLWYASENIVQYAYPELGTRYANIAASVVGVAVARHLQVPVIPTELADAYKCSNALAESILDEYDVETGKFQGLPWMM